MSSIELHSDSPQQTRALAEVLAAALRPGDVVALTGELGAGKTAFVKGAAAALGVVERVTSPSFVLVRSYAGRVPVVHMDVYRLHSLQDVIDLGYDELADSDAVVFIEWGDAMRPLLPADHLEVEFRRLPDPEAWNRPEEAVVEQAEPRRIVVRAHGNDWTRRLAALSTHLEPWRGSEETTR